MKIAVASGKGGTGKTTVAVNLAFVAAGRGERVRYLDCDVEEPNGHIFLSPEITESLPVTIPVPEVDESLCTSCGECKRICQYKAITLILDKVITFPELCHGCGGCSLVCPTEAITEVPREMGVVESGSVLIDGFTNGSDFTFYQGRLNIKEALAVPVIRKVKEFVDGESMNIIDAPPGTSCPVIESVRGVDFVVLVTEPTPFGLNDLALAVETLTELQIPMGVVVNRDGIGNNDVYDFCRDKGLEVLGRIPFDRRIAEVYSRGEIISRVIGDYKETMNRILDRVLEITGSGGG